MEYLAFIYAVHYVQPWQAGHQLGTNGPPLRSGLVVEVEKFFMYLSLVSVSMVSSLALCSRLFSFSALRCSHSYNSCGEGERERERETERERERERGSEPLIEPNKP